MGRICKPLECWVKETYRVEDVVIGLFFVSAWLSSAVTDSQALAARPCPIDSVWSSFHPYDRVARALPEFGGIYRDTTIIVLLTDMSAGTRAEPIIRRLFRNRPGMERETIRFESAKYSHRQLRSWRECLRVDLVGGVVGVGIGSRDGRVSIDIVADSTLRRIEAAIRKRGIPRDAFTFERTKHRVPLSTPHSTGAKPSRPYPFALSRFHAR